MHNSEEITGTAGTSAENTSIEFITCIGKGGLYTRLGTAKGAGTKLDSDDVVVYLDVVTAAMYYRSDCDFHDRMERVASPPTKTLTIMPDFGMSPYAWLKPISDMTRYVGANAAGYGSTPNEFPISEDLHNRFIQWCGPFESRSDQPDFDWASFHADGLALTRELKSQVGPEFLVRYVKPHEDPAYRASTPLLVE